MVCPRTVSPHARTHFRPGAVPPCDPRGMDDREPDVIAVAEALAEIGHGVAQADAAIRSASAGALAVRTAEVTVELVLAPIVRPPAQGGIGLGVRTQSTASARETSRARVAFTIASTREPGSEAAREHAAAEQARRVADESLRAAEQTRAIAREHERRAAELVRAASAAGHAMTGEPPLGAVEPPPHAPPPRHDEPISPRTLALQLMHTLEGIDRRVQSAPLPTEVREALHEELRAIAAHTEAGDLGTASQRMLAFIRQYGELFKPETP